MLLPLAWVWIAGLGDRPYSTPDEARYVEIPREMVASGNWVTPRLNGVQYFEKPPLFYWVQASMQQLGASPTHEGWMRLPTLLIALVGLMGTWFFGKRFTEPDTAYKATWMLATCVLYYAHSRLIILDMTVSVCVMMAFYGFYTAMQGSQRHQRRWMYVTTISVACGILTKGIVVLALLGPVWVTWLTWDKLWGRLRYIPSSLALFVLCVAPWHIICGMQNPDFFHKYFFVEHFMRYTTTVHGRYQPVWYFIPIAWVGFLPWSATWPRLTWTPLQRYLVLWAVWVLAFYSFSNSKLIPYILPMMAPLALLWAENFRIQRYTSILWGLAAAGFLAAPAFFPELYHTKQSLLPFLYGASACLTLMAYLMWWRPVWSMLALTSLPLMWILNFGAIELQKPSIKPLVPFMLEQQKAHGGEFVSWRTYLQDLPVYTQQIVNVADAMNELEYGAHAEDTNKWIFSQDEMLKRVDKRYYLVGRMADKQYIPQGYKIIRHTQHYFVATNFVVP